MSCYTRPIISLVTFCGYSTLCMFSLSWDLLRLCESSTRNLGLFALSEGLDSESTTVGL